MTHLTKRILYSSCVVVATMLAYAFASSPARCEEEVNNPQIMPAHDELTRPIESLVVSSEGDFAIIAEDDGNIWKWVFANPTIDYGPAPVGRVSRMLLSSDDAVLVYGVQDSSIYSWDVKRRWLSRVTNGRHDPLAILRSRMRAIGVDTSEEFPRIVYWDASTEPWIEVTSHRIDSFPRVSQVSPNGQLLVSIPLAHRGRKEVPAIWKIDIDDVTRSFDDEARSLTGATAIEFTKNGDLLAAGWGHPKDPGGIDSIPYPQGLPVEIGVFDTIDWKKRIAIRVCDEGRIHDLSFSPDGNLLAVSVSCREAKERGMLRVHSFIDIYDVSRRERITSITGDDAKKHRHAVFNFIAFLPDRNRLLCCWAGKSVQLWNLRERLARREGKREEDETGVH